VTDLHPREPPKSKFDPTSTGKCCYPVLKSGSEAAKKSVKEFLSAAFKLEQRTSADH
jgi:hypothetical protein